ncbi:MAG: hypothetical protein IJ164_05015 [Duodenibacillus sp.]|nr:hypothetical protein [Duodenibacillus sp.]
MIFTRNILCVLAAAAAVSLSAEAAVRESVTPSVHGLSVPLMRDNLITQKLGGRILNLDLWAGEFAGYDSNVFSTRSAKRSSMINTSAGGFVLQARQSGTWGLTMQGQIERVNYKSVHSANRTQGRVRASADASFSPALSVHGSAGYSRGFDRIREQSRFYRINRYHAGTGLTLSPTPYLSVSADYGFAANRRTDRVLKYAEYDRHTVSLRPSYRITDHTSTYVLLAASKISMQERHYSDSTNLSALWGLSWNYRETGVTAELGATVMRFESNGNRSLVDEVGKNKTAPRLSLAGGLCPWQDWRIRAAASWSSAIGADSTNTPHSAYFEVKRVSAEIGYSPNAGYIPFENRSIHESLDAARLVLSVSPFYAKVSPSSSRDASWREFGGELKGSYKAADWISISAKYLFTNTKFNDDARFYKHQVMLGLALTI